MEQISRITGLCRFSFPSPRGFKKRFDDAAAQAAYLYDPTRMEARFAGFEALTLAALDQQTDGDFELVVLIGSNMPTVLQDRMTALLSARPYARLVTLDPMHHYRAAQLALETSRPDAGIWAQFKMDDDDAVSRDFIAALRQDFELAQSAFAASGRAAIDYPYGFVLDTGSKPARLAEVERNFWGVGMGVYLPHDTDESVLNFPHLHIYRHMPVISHGRAGMFLRGVNGHNDSQIQGIEGRFAPVTEPDKQSLKATFGVELPD